MKLDGTIAVVTGATRGVGAGVARELAREGARVFATGRSIDAAARTDDSITRIPCDHTQDAQVDAAFDRILSDLGRIDLLVNNVWGGYERMIEDGRFTWSLPF